MSVRARLEKLEQTTGPACPECARPFMFPIVLGPDGVQVLDLSDAPPCPACGRERLAIQVVYMKPITLDGGKEL